MEFGLQELFPVKGVYRGVSALGNGMRTRNFVNGNKNNLLMNLQFAPSDRPLMKGPERYTMG